MISVRQAGTVGHDSSLVLGNAIQTSTLSFVYSRMYVQNSIPGTEPIGDKSFVFANHKPWRFNLVAVLMGTVFFALAAWMV